MKIGYKRVCIPIHDNVNLWRHNYAVDIGEQRFKFVRTYDGDMPRVLRAWSLRKAHRDLWKHIHDTLDAQSSNSESL